MSGFAGIISADCAPPDRLLLGRIAARFTFRGPDATHITTQLGAGFCFTFLRTGPAPQSSLQPVSLDSRVWLIGDVRLDGRDDLRRKLEQHGTSVPSIVTDEELILHAYQMWGEQSFADLLGDYAFALWDSADRRLLCLRDLIGSRPFFYAHIGGSFLFSNTLNVLRLAPQVSADLDLQYIGDFLLQGWCPDLARSAFRDISRLTPGHRLRYSRGSLDVQRFTSLPIEKPLLLKRQEEYVEQFRAFFEQAVRERLPQGPVSIFMSGGLDSTSVAAIAVDNSRKSDEPLDLHSYTLDCRPDLDDDEGWLAAMTAQRLGIPNEIRPATTHVPYEGWNDPRFPLPEPLDDPFRLLYLELIRDAARHSRVTLHGFGGDDIMTGQAWPYLLYLLRRCSFGRLGHAFGGYALRHGRLPPLRGGFRQKFRRLFVRDDPMADYPIWLAQKFECELRLRERWLERQRGFDKSHPWYPDGHGGINGGSWASVLESHDAAWTGELMQSRAPLLDLRILRFLLRVPPVPLCINKELLRRTFHGVLPEEVRVRPKQPFHGDLLALQIESRKWSLKLLPQPSDAIRTFVDWAKLSASLECSTGPSRYADLRPFSLLYWIDRNVSH